MIIMWPRTCRKFGLFVSNLRVRTRSKRYSRSGNVTLIISSLHTECGIGGKSICILNMHYPKIENNGLCTPTASRFVPRRSARARCALSSILAQVLNQRVMFPERRVGSFVVCMSHTDKQWSNFYAKNRSLNGERPRFRVIREDRVIWLKSRPLRSNLSHYTINFLRLRIFLRLAAISYF